MVRYKPNNTHKSNTTNTYAEYKDNLNGEIVKKPSKSKKEKENKGSEKIRNNQYQVIIGQVHVYKLL